jgi:hypothetical protein
MSGPVTEPKVAHMQCPLCGKVTKTERGLTKHLTGGRRYGGHELMPTEAIRRAADAAAVELPADPTGGELAADALVDLPPEVKAGFLFQALARLVDNKDLPKYQFERAIDGFLGAFLPGILESVVGGDVTLVAQSFR